MNPRVRFYPVIAQMVYHAGFLYRVAVISSYERLDAKSFHQFLAIQRFVLEYNGPTWSLLPLEARTSRTVFDEDFKRIRAEIQAWLDRKLDDTGRKRERLRGELIEIRLDLRELPVVSLPSAQFER